MPNPNLIKMYKVMLLALLFILFSCNSNDDTFVEQDTGTEQEDSSDENNNYGDTTDSKPNILLIIADDMGLDASPGYEFVRYKSTAFE